MTDNKYCRICAFSEVPIKPSHGDSKQIDCPACKSYRIDGALDAGFRGESLSLRSRSPATDPPWHLVAAATRRIHERRERGENVEMPFFEKEDDFANLVNKCNRCSPPLPRTPFEKIDELVRLVGKAQGGNAALFLSYDAAKDYPLLACVGGRDTDREMMTLVNMAINDMKLVKADGSRLRLTAKGLAKFESLPKHPTKLPKHPTKLQGFVAMSFSPEMQSIYKDAIRPAIKAAGFAPLRIDEKPHNDGIVDQIISELRRSSFVVADFTGNCSGVYYEAGFAHGLDLPVIPTCEESYFKEHSVHFDWRHRNILTWPNTRYLKKELVRRIRAIGTLAPKTQA